MPNINSRRFPVSASPFLAVGRDLREIQLYLGHQTIDNTTKYIERRSG